MAWTQTDLDTIESAISAGVLRVRFSDGREVFYQATADLLKARDVMKAALNAASGSGVRSTLASFSKG